MSEPIWISLITAIIGPLVLFGCQMLKEKRENLKQMIIDEREHLTQMILENREVAAKDTKDVRLQSLRLEIMFTLKHHPEDESTILGLYDKYRALGGNSFISEYVQNWKQRHKKGKKK